MHTLTDTFSVQSADGTTQNITVTITGTNDVPVIGGISSGSVKEDVGVSGGNIVASGALTISDVDTGESSFVAQSDVAGNYGSLFSIDENGNWSYHADNSNAAIQQLPEGATLTDTFSVQSADGTTQNITVTITGTNDVPVIGGISSGSVKEDVGVSGGNMVASGALTISDVDTGESSFVAQS